MENRDCYCFMKELRIPTGRGYILLPVDSLDHVIQTTLYSPTQGLEMHQSQEYSSCSHHAPVPRLTWPHTTAEWQHVIGVDVIVETHIISWHTFFSTNKIQRPHLKDQCAYVPKARIWRRKSLFHSSNYVWINIKGPCKGSIYLTIPT